MELSRQRLRPALSEGSHVTCPRCNGVGQVRDTDSSALHILRILQEEAMKESTAAVHAQVPVDVATYLLNEKRADIAKLEARQRVSIVLIPNKFLETPHYSIERLRHDDERLDLAKASYDRVIAPPTDEPYTPAAQIESKNRRQNAVVKGIVPETPAPIVVHEPVSSPAASAAPASTPVQEKSFWARLRAWFGAEPEPASKPPRREASAAAGADAPGARTTERSRGGRGEQRDGARKSERSGGRDRRPERGARGERPDGERKERADNRGEAPREGAREGQREGQRDGQRGGRTKRDEPRRDRPPVAEAAATGRDRPTAEGQTAPEAEAGAERSSANRRRGRRDRGPQGERAISAENSSEILAGNAPLAADGETREPVPAVNGAGIASEVTNSALLPGAADEGGTPATAALAGSEEEKRGRRRRRRRGRSGSERTGPAAGPNEANEANEGGDAPLEGGAMGADQGFDDAEEAFEGHETPAAQSVPVPVQGHAERPASIADGAAREALQSAPSSPFAGSVTSPAASALESGVAHAVARPVEQPAAQSVTQLVAPPVVQAVAQTVAPAMAQPAIEAPTTRMVNPLLARTGDAAAQDPSGAAPFSTVVAAMEALASSGKAAPLLRPAVPPPPSAPLATSGGGAALASAASVPPKSLDLEELAPALNAAGIELAQTDPAKMAAAQARIASEDKPQRVGRERPARAPVEDEPLQQVQTRH
jgi:ribonuclease E